MAHVKPIVRQLGLAAMAAAIVAGVAACAAHGASSHGTQALARIGHIVVIYEENRSFDSFFGDFPGANGRANAGAAATQVDAHGTPYAQLPPVINTLLPGKPVDARFPAHLPNAPFPINPWVAESQKTSDLVHRFYQEQQQIDGGRMDRFAGVSDAGGLTMGYWDISDTYIYKLAQHY